MNFTNPINKILHEKRGKFREFYVVLFEACDLSCSFCIQDHNDFTGIDSIEEKANKIVSMLSDDFDYQINIMGGELFMDSIPDDVFLKYEKFCDIIFNSGKNIIGIGIISNLVFTKHQRVRDLFNKLKSKYNVNLISSYDSTGRFNKHTKEIYLENLKRFKDILLGVTVVCTRKTISTLLKKDDECIDYIYNNGISMCFDSLSNCVENDPSRPTIKEYVDFMLHLYKRYPNVESFNRLKLGAGLHCVSGIHMNAQGETGACRFELTRGGKKEVKKWETLKNIHSSEVRFVDKYNCLSCEYFNKCRLTCFSNFDMQPQTEDNECHIKRMYEEIMKDVDENTVIKVCNYEKSN